MSDSTLPPSGGQSGNDQERQWPDVAGFGRPTLAAEALSMIAALYNDGHNPTEELRAMPYAEYLKTPYWQELRRSKVRAAGFRCERCRASNVRLDVHHLSYERRGHESRDDLVVLCRSCHEAEHGVGQ
jgi:hypothetical protein